MLALSVGQILLFMAEFGLNQHLVPLLARKENEQGDILVQVSMLKGMLLACGCLGMLFFVHWQGYSHGLKMLVFVLGIGVGMEALASSFFVAFQVEGHQRLEGKIKAMGATLGFGYGLIPAFPRGSPLDPRILQDRRNRRKPGRSAVHVCKKSQPAFSPAPNPPYLGNRAGQHRFHPYGDCGHFV